MRPPSGRRISVSSSALESTTLEDRTLEVQKSLWFKSSMPSYGTFRPWPASNTSTISGAPKSLSPMIQQLLHQRGSAFLSARNRNHPFMWKSSTNAPVPGCRSKVQPLPSCATPERYTQGTWPAPLELSESSFRTRVASSAIATSEAFCFSFLSSSSSGLRNFCASFSATLLTIFCLRMWVEGLRQVGHTCLVFSHCFKQMPQNTWSSSHIV
mmetsp:Transcript_11559/g.39897  ORF Transcript_11559/g.39897 Transcript_11559/m.39897 type:complete len:212 (-) Transcript_11559:3192-3827(-)